MNFLEIANVRQSCRAYDEARCVEQEKLEAILEAARLAPSACNGQPYKITVCRGQAAKDVASGLVVSARSEDGVIEGLEMPSAPFVVGVQWHPERLVGHDQNAKALLRRFVREAEKGR